MLNTQNKNLSLTNNEIPCQSALCKSKAISLSPFCWEHTLNKNEHIEKLRDYLNRSNGGEGFILHKVVMRNSDLIRVNLRNSDLSQADFKNTNFSYSDITNANLIGCDLEGCDFTSANLENSDLTKANLKKTRFWHADLSHANFAEADMTEADLWKSEMFSARLWHTELKDVKSLTKQNFSKKICCFFYDERIDERGELSAVESYRRLKQYFMQNGLYNEASWASFKEKTMEKIWLRRNRNISYFPMAVMGLLCGYGEKPKRVIFSSAAIILFYSVLYYFFKMISNFKGTGLISFWDNVYYSMVTFTTLGYGDLIPKQNIAYRLLAGSEAFVGAFMIGLFVFTLSRKYSSR